LEREGLLVTWVKDGISAVGVARRDPDIVLVILDMHLPGLDGVKVCQAIKEGPVPPRVIAMSAYSAESDLKMLGDQRPELFLSKPFSPRELVNHVYAQLEHVHVD